MALASLLFFFFLPWHAASTLCFAIRLGFHSWVHNFPLFQHFDDLHLRVCSFLHQFRLTVTNGFVNLFPGMQFLPQALPTGIFFINSYIVSQIECSFLHHVPLTFTLGFGPLFPGICSFCPMLCHPVVFGSFVPRFPRFQDFNGVPSLECSFLHHVHLCI